MSRLNLQTAARAGAVTLVNGFRTSANISISQVYRSRPAQIKATAVFVDSVGEDTTSFTREESQRVVRVAIRAVWGQYDSGAAVDQRDAFVDGFYGWVMDHYHVFGDNTECVWVGTADDESWTPEWLPDDPNVYFSTIIILEGRAST